VLVSHLSITLRDAQHICWKNFRKIKDRLDPEQGKTWTPSIAVLDLLEETSRLASIVKALEGHKNGKNPETEMELAKGLSNIIYTVFVLAEHYNIKLEEVFLQTINDYFLSFI